MAKSKFPLLGAFAAFVSIGLAAIIVVDADPTPAARAQSTQLASTETPAGLRGRGSDAASHIRVVDGDTLEDMREDVTYRIVNIDTPETGSRARCNAERALGDRATALARSLISRASELELRPTGRIDRYGRTIAFVLTDGRDLGEALIAEGVARPWRGRREPWCDAAGNLIP
jgi:endonuclease YncB( thermonuclease family)